MGITNLKKLLTKVATKRHLSSYGGKRLAVDASIWLYRFLYRDDEHAILEGLLRQLRQFHKYQITPVYVFDGKSSSEVKLVVEKRQQQRQRVKDALDNLGIELEETLETLGDPVSAALVMEEIETAPVGNIRLNDERGLMPFAEMDVPLFVADEDDEEFYGGPAPTPAEDREGIAESEDLMLKAVRIQSRIQSLQKQVRRPTKEAVEECKQLLDLLGVPHVQSPGESDVTLAEMFLRGQVQGIMSEDTDMLPYGCECFITGFADNSDFVTEYRLSDVLRELKMTRAQFVDFCILCGCDYADKIYKIAIKTAFTLIHKCSTIEGVLTHIASNRALAERHTYSKNFMEKVHRARNMFLTRTPTGETRETGETGETVEVVAEPPPFVWDLNRAVASEQNFCQFLSEHDFTIAQYVGLCRTWTGGLPKAQKTLFDYYKK